MAYVKPLSPRQMLAGIGKRLQSLRISRRLSQQDLASAAGVSVRTLRRLEAEGDARLETVARIALALRVQHQFDGFFAAEETRTLDEILEAQRRPKRVRKPARR
jgi:transcriptional regulator with XRE-family HTH domain